MTGLFLSQRFIQTFGPEIDARAREAGLDAVTLPFVDRPETLPSPDVIDGIELAFFSSDLRYGNVRAFFDALDAAPKLRWVHHFGVGIDGRFERFFGRGVRVTNSVGVNSEPVALTAITGLLMLARGFHRWGASQREGVWRPYDFDSPEAPADLKDQTLVVVGMGAIGKRIAELGRALGFGRVFGVRRGPARGDEPCDEVLPATDLDRVLPAADWLVLAPILTPETKGMIDARRLALLPRGAHLVNISRGAVVDETALVEALSSGRLGGAYLDVFSREPLPAESPLWRLPNVVVTPHNSAISRGKYRREADLFFENLVRLGQGRELVNELTSSRS